MKSKHIIALLTLTLPCLALAQSDGKYQCSYGELQRRVEILTEPGVTVPCEVHYYKDTEAPGETQVLWSAAAQEGFCESKAEEFIAKLEGWGWDCGRAAAPAAPETPAEPEAVAEPEAAPAPEAPAEPEVQDDTDVLSPGEPAE
jgi:hypothetical protein